MTQEEMNKEQEKPRKSRGCGVKLLLLSIVVLVLGALAGYAYLKIEDKTPEQVVAAAQQSASEYVSQLLANSAVNMSASNTSGRAVELYSLYEKDFVVVYEYSTSWMFSTKKIKVIQPYRVRYGISTTKADLQCGWKTYNEIIQVGNLKPCVISCERFGLQQYEGWLRSRFISMVSCSSPSSVDSNQRVSSITRIPSSSKASISTSACG